MQHTNTFGFDSTVTLQWICGNGNYKQFVGIQETQYIQWRQVGTAQIPAALGSCRYDADKLAVLWWQGPNQLSEPEKWPADILTSSTKDSEAEVKGVQELLAVAVENKRHF